MSNVNRQKSLFNIRYSIFIIVFLFSCTSQKVGKSKAIVQPYSTISTKDVTFKNGCVVSAYPVASQVGNAILQKGGNAFDAMIATQLALAVVYPNAGNLGGGGFMMARRSNGELIAIDYREEAPLKSGRNMYLDSLGNAITELSQNGHLSSGVPGTVAGLFAEYKYAKLPFKELIQPAINLASKGYVLTNSEARSFNYNKNDFIKYNTQPTAFVKQTEWKGGDTLLQPQLAATLQRIKDNGAKGFYEGETARLIVEEMKRGNGIISPEDLKNYKAKERKPISINYKGYNVISFPPPSSGGLLLAQMLKMVEPFDLKKYGFNSTAAIHVMVEAERRAFADRSQHMGDADFYRVPVDALLSDAYLKQRMSDFDSSKAGSSNITKAGVLPYESKQTTHISIIDKEGNMVAVTTTLNDSYGSKTVVGGAGFFLNDEMDDFSIKPGVPNMYGATGGDANAIEPGKRMLSSMTPTLVLKDNKPFMVVGTPGGTTIPTSVFQTIVDVIDFNISSHDAINQPKLHHQWLPDVVTVESSLPDYTVESLKNMGYKIEKVRQIGRTELILIHPDGIKEAVADGRGDDSAAGY